MTTNDEQQPDEAQEIAAAQAERVMEHLRALAELEAIGCKPSVHLSRLPMAVCEVLAPHLRHLGTEGQWQTFAHGDCVERYRQWDGELCGVSVILTSARQSLALDQVEWSAPPAREGAGS